MIDDRMTPGENVLLTALKGTEKLMTTELGHIADHLKTLNGTVTDLCKAREVHEARLITIETRCAMIQDDKRDDKAEAMAKGVSDAKKDGQPPDATRLQALNAILTALKPIILTIALVILSVITGLDVIHALQLLAGGK